MIFFYLFVKSDLGTVIWLVFFIKHTVTLYLVFVKHDVSLMNQRVI